MQTVLLRVSQIEPDRNQARKYFNEQALFELAESISQYGIIEPIVVKPMENGFYKIIAGERRWRASRMAQLREIPAIVKDDISEVDAFKMSFAENLQRQSLTPIEEALGFVRMRDEFNMTQQEISNATGKSRSTVANVVRLLKLPQSVQNMVEDGSLSVAHAKLILSLDSEYQEQFARLTVEKSLSVVQLENEIKRFTSKPKHRTKKRNSIYVETELSLMELLNRPIKIDGSENKGTITIEFYGKDDLKKLISNIEDIL
jgi:ParB family chromosome partitioning protein